MLVWSGNKTNLAHVNHSQLCTWNRPVLWGYSFLLKETTGAFDGAQTRNWPNTRQTSLLLPNVLNAQTSFMILTTSWRKLGIYDNFELSKCISPTEKDHKCDGFDECDVQQKAMEKRYVLEPIVYCTVFTHINLTWILPNTI